MPLKKTPMSNSAIKELIAQGVADALAEYELHRYDNPNGDISHNSGSGNGRPVRTARECTHKEFLNYQPLNFNGTEGVNAMENADEDDDRQLALMCERMFLEEFNEVKKYVGGLPYNIQGNMMSARPTTMQEAIELVNDLMDQKQNVTRAYSVGPSEKRKYAGTLLLCNKCKFYHNGPWNVKCANCKRVGYLTRNYRSPTATNNQRTLTCFKCGNQRHYRSDYLELKNRNCGNQAGSSEACGGVYALGGGETDQDPNIIKDEIAA
uniref:Reverse transcriptase domain-containing protein n=1 Tax=Tanacetum cinerariifolium TaxID=118510 RepID=A0A6L2KND3_TANCI|nr:hypothetical protein [Tanacetum cinerariifolium]